MLKSVALAEVQAQGAMAAEAGVPSAPWSNLQLCGGL